MNDFTIPSGEIDLAKHACSLAVVACIDFRFREAQQRFIEETFKTSDFDYLSFPGGGKNFATDSAKRTELTAAVKNVCIGLHHISTLLVLNHWDCGAYGGSKAFVSPEEEERMYREDLTRAASFLQKEFPGLTVKAGYSKSTPDGLTFHILD